MTAQPQFGDLKPLWFRAAPDKARLLSDMGNPPFAPSQLHKPAKVRTAVPARTASKSECHPDFCREVAIATSSRREAEPTLKG